MNITAKIVVLCLLFAVLVIAAYAAGHSTSAILKATEPPCGILFK